MVNPRRWHSARARARRGAGQISVFTPLGAVIGTSRTKATSTAENMPATAGRVKMPANNRMQTSASLNTHSIWQNAIGYDPYAAEQKAAETSVSVEAATSAQDNMKALLALAKSNRAAMEEEKGSWRGASQLRGGWAGGRDLGVAPSSELSLSRTGRRDKGGDDMPSSTSSFESDREEDPERAAHPDGGASSSAAAAESGGKKRSREESEGESRAKKGKHKHKKDKRKHHKKDKHKQKDEYGVEKKKHKHRHRDSD